MYFVIDKHNLVLASSYIKIRFVLSGDEYKNYSVKKLQLFKELINIIKVLSRYLKKLIYFEIKNRVTD